MKSVQQHITEEQLIVQFGPDALLNLSNDNGYQVEVRNPDYVEPTYNPVTLEELTPAQGEPTIPNPQTRMQFIAQCIRDKGIDGTASPTRERMRRAAIKQAEDAFAADFDARVQAIKDSITVEVVE